LTLIFQDFDFYFIRHFTIADHVHDVQIIGLSLVHGLARDGLGSDADGGGCVLMGQDASLSLSEVTLQHCNAPQNSESGRGGAIFVGARSTLSVKESTIADCSSGQNGGGIYSDKHSHLEMFGVVLETLSTGTCPCVSTCPCISNAWVDSYGDDCKAYAKHPSWCGFGESDRNCCACGGGRRATQFCEPTGAGGAYFAASHVSITMQSVEFRFCTAALMAGGAYLEHNVVANISDSAFLDCVSTDGGAMMLNGNVSLRLTNISMHRNRASSSNGRGHGGALKAAVGGNTISIHNGTVVDNFAGKDGAGFHLTSSILDATHLSVNGNTATEFGGAAYLETSSTLTVSSSSMDDNMAGGNGGGVWAHESSTVILQVND